jgi:hypothetical protein
VQHGEWLGFGRQTPLSGFLNEAALAQAVLTRLEPWFHVTTEVRGRHPLGATCRIDAVLLPRNPHDWKRKDVALGIEFKALDAREAWGRADLTAWVAQAIDYAYVDWDHWGKLPIFMCPSPLAGADRLADGPIEAVESFAHGLLGQYGIGFLADYERPGLSLVLQERHRIWSERHGVEHGRHWALRPRVGHRR